MRKWNTSKDITLVDRFVRSLLETRLVEPGGALPGDPVDLQGLFFPSVTLCTELELPTVIAKRVGGQREFSHCVLRRVNLSNSRLDYCVWINCSFLEVSFDRARLENGRFFGCKFDNCSFRSTDLKDASFSVGPDGSETTFGNTCFQKADFRGASCHNPVFNSTRFDRCRLTGFTFEGPLCRNVAFLGSYKDLRFRAYPGEPERNRLDIDLSKARLCWLEADDGVDLTSAVLPSDGSCIVIVNRIVSIERICSRLAAELPCAAEVARILAMLFSNRALSPLSACQTMFMLSQNMIKECDDNLTKGQVLEVFSKIRTIADEEGFAAQPRKGPETVEARGGAVG